LHCEQQGKQDGKQSPHSLTIHPALFSGNELYSTRYRCGLWSRVLWQAGVPARRFEGWTSLNSPVRIRDTRSFHSEWLSRTVFWSSPMLTPSSLISTEGQCSQFVQSVTVIFSIRFTS
jgi:hypothetical protein